VVEAHLDVVHLGETQLDEMHLDLVHPGVVNLGELQSGVVLLHEVLLLKSSWMCFIQLLSTRMRPTRV